MTKLAAIPLAFSTAIGQYGVVILLKNDGEADLFTRLKALYSSFIPAEREGCPHRRRKKFSAIKCRPPTQWICWTFLSISRNNEEGQ
ncbi:hypothetical protein [Serratia entomophila]|uniref:Uncharacterized protein n=1 Tax=Serratia entomophila TaxID=42906 RepID=A0ABY5CQV3_9GAMM|nr:hypothetical protein [Serratia entomophila]USU99829.1 hypothetical protein KFQ06_17525 [Serratia entomophila]